MSAPRQPEQVSLGPTANAAFVAVVVAAYVSLLAGIAAKSVAEFQRLARRPVATPEPSSEALSDREVGILRLVSRGATNREIAASLALAEGTVKNHATNILG